MVSDNSEHLNTPEAIQYFVKYNLGDGNKAVPFHWETWTENGEKKVKYSLFNSLTADINILDLREFTQAI